MHPGVIRQFDATDGLGDILLDDGRAVRFGITALKDFRSVAPASGLRVLVRDIKPGFKGALRATEVRLADVSFDETWHVYGLDAPRMIADPSGLARRIRLLPFDPRAFARVAEGLSAETVAQLAFGAARAVHVEHVHPMLAALAPAVGALARTAWAFACVPGEPDVGASFVGGAFADLGTGEWPVIGGTPLVHVLQIGRADAARIGIDKQVNVFASTAPVAPVGPVLQRLGLAPLFGAVPRGDSPFVVIASSGGSRRHGPTRGIAHALGRAELRTTFPGVDAFVSTDDEVQRQITAMIDRSYVVADEGLAVASDLTLRSIQTLFRAAFPTADAVGDDVVLAGIAPRLAGSSRKRLASLRLDSFPELNEFCSGDDRWLAREAGFVWRRWAIDVSPDATASVWAYAAR